jgi:hypothetical protein
MCGHKVIPMASRGFFHLMMPHFCSEFSYDARAAQMGKRNKRWLLARRGSAKESSWGQG